MQITVNKPPLMLGVKEAAAHFGISQHYCRQLALSGTVKAVRVGRGKILVNCDSLAAFFDSARIADQINKTAHGLQRKGVPAASPDDGMCPSSGIHPIPVKI